ncbi:hypothetical protein ACFW9D_04320 [Streptomyces sp. NPDC059524]|uniref:hypothetical protein n=1 Tax=Streptomyces sp. NPDC059524 TaxID=3346856 RepID=UPI0036AE74F1
MNDTVAVALVTGGSTLVAAVVSSWLALRAAGRQAQTQRLQASEERLEARAMAQRGIRREVYRKFLEQASETRRLVFALRTSADLDQAEFDAAAGQAREAIRELAAVEPLIMLEGPEPVIDAAEKVVAALRHEHSAARALYLDRRPGPWQNYEEAQAQRIQALRDLWTTARKALGSDISTA